MTNRKAIVKGTIKISFIVAVLAALGFLVFNYALPVLALHTSTASLEPEWSPSGQNVDYTVTLCNDVGSEDEVDEVRIYKNPGYTDFIADEKAGWYLGSYNPVKGYYPYTATSSDYFIDPDECTDFIFSATVPSYPVELCDLSWKFETRDVTETWRAISDTTSIDSDLPIIEKSISGVSFGDCPPGLGEECWIRQDTGVNVYATDPTEKECNSGLDRCEWSYTVDGESGNSGTWYPDENGIIDETIYFSENSVHVLNVTCIDKAKNVNEEIETFKVDSEPPETTKIYDGITKPEIYNLYDEILVNVDYITINTPIVLTPVDPGPEHASGVASTWYIIKVPCEWYENPEYECDQPEWLGLLDQEIYYDYNSCAINNGRECEITWWNVKWEVTPDWTPYVDPFVIPQESVHKICFYSVDNLGNEEQKKCQVAIVDDTPPLSVKEIGRPRMPDDSNLEELGDATAEWSTDEASSGSFSARLYVPDTSGDDYAGVDSFFDVFVQLDSITDISYDRKVLSFGSKAWSPLVVLGIDADGDGIFEAQPLEWQQSGWNPIYLGDDSFIQCEETVPIEIVELSLVSVDAFNTFSCYTPNVVGDGYDWDVYRPLSYFQSNNVGRVETTDKVAMVKVEIGGSLNFDNEVVYVDNVVFNENTIIDEPAFTWVSQETSISLDCRDQEPHPVDQETVYWRFSTYLDGFESDPTYSDWYSAPYTEFPVEIKFTEDSWHDLEYYCVDYLGNDERDLNNGEPNKQYYIVESVPPVLSKDMFGSYLGDCPSGTDIDHGDCFVADNRQSGVTISVEDPQPHPVDDVSCYYQLWWNGPQGLVLVDSDGFSNSADVIFTEDSEHELYIYCEDALGNWVEDEEEFLVDSTPPVTTKEYGKPYVEDYFPKGCNYDNDNCNGDGCDGNGYRCGWAEWINSSTPISLSAEDNKVAVDKTYWRNLIVQRGDPEYLVCGFPQYYCNPQFYMQYVQNPDEEWNEWTGEPFTKDEESCHVIEYYSVDELGNEEDLNWQCVFVDNTEPEVWKEVGEPKVEGEEGIFYISQETPITLFCADVYPHPVDHVSLWYRYRVSEDCENWGDWTDWVDPNGYVAEKTIFFEQDSCHELEYYCEDGLGNVGPIQTEIDIVDTQPPVIEKTIVGPQIDCIEYDGQLDCFQIDGVTSITVDAFDPEPHPVSDVTCDWSYVVEETEASNGEEEVTPPFVIQFPEESTHDLTITCRDALGNEASDEEIFIVDKTPPETTKTYDGSQYPGQGYPEWITSDTNVILDATDDVGPHDSGVKATYWRNTLVDDTYCDGVNIIEDDDETNDDLLDCDDAVGSGEWNLYADSFNKDEESCHLIEFYSVDNVEKTEPVKKQCVFVDNTPPTPDKKVGEPKAVWDGKDANFYDIADLCWNGHEDEIECWKTTLLTPIKLDCTDPDPHPVNNEQACFKVEWDGDDQTETYCDNLEGDLTEDGFCCVSEEVTFMFDKISEHELEYYCEDALGNSNKENLDIEKFKVEETSFNITINKKWNLISTPVVLLDDSMKVIFGEESDTIEAVWTYDGETEHWYVYTPDGEDNDNLDTMIPGWGYWVKAWKDDVLVIGGSLMSPGKIPPSKTIVEGWNLVGYYGAEGQEGYDGPDGNGDQANCVFNSLGEDVLDKEFTSLWTYWEPYNPYHWIPYDQWDNMDPGAGYWLATPQNGLYMPSTTCGWD